MPDFTAHIHPVLAVRCPECGKAPGVWCCRPSGHRASDLHKARRIAADCLFVAQHGEDASIERDGEECLGGGVRLQEARTRDQGQSRIRDDEAHHPRAEQGQATCRTDHRGRRHEDRDLCRTLDADPVKHSDAGGHTSAGRRPIDREIQVVPVCMTVPMSAVSEAGSRDGHRLRDLGTDGGM